MRPFKETREIIVSLKGRIYDFLTTNSNNKRKDNFVEIQKI